MATTIQVEKDTVQFLKSLRKAYQASSYDEVLKRMRKQLLRRETLSGVLSHMPKKRLMEGLRDKGDRY